VCPRRLPGTRHSPPYAAPLPCWCRKALDAVWRLYTSRKWHPTWRGPSAVSAPLGLRRQRLQDVFQCLLKRGEGPSRFVAAQQ
jgi:hypothetical protein